MFTLQSAGLTDVGRSRSNNEDAFLVTPPIFMVADGMGGAAAGEIASRMAIDIISADLAGITLTTDGEVEKKVHDAFRHADHEMKLLMKKNPSYLGMGTTLVMAIHFGERMFLANIGDSRAYVITGLESPEKTGSITRLTRDHSVVMDMAMAGIITEETIRAHPLRNRITRALGSFGDSEPEFFWQSIGADDTFLLCSDGLWEMVHEQMMLAIVRSSRSPEEINTRLVKAANLAGGADNITLVTVRVE